MSTIVITGASSGIGAIAADRLAKQGHDVAVVGRNPERTRQVAASVGGTPFVADFDRLDDVRSLADALIARYPRIDVLANNAGGLISSKRTTADGYEATIQHNHLAPFLLTHLLMPRLAESRGRVVSTSSAANLFGKVRPDNLNRTGHPYLGGWRAYGTSKLATILFTKELARRADAAASGVQAFAFHPGFVATSFGSDRAYLRASFALVAYARLTPEAGAAPLIELTGEDSIGASNGTYFDGLKPDGRTLPSAHDEALASRLWETSARMVGVAA